MAPGIQPCVLVLDRLRRGRSSLSPDLLAASGAGPAGPRRRPRQRRGRQPIKGATVTAENPNIGADDLHGHDRRQRPLLDHRAARGPVAVRRAGARPRSRRRRDGGPVRRIAESADHVHAPQDRPHHGGRSAASRRRICRPISPRPTRSSSSRSGTRRSPRTGRSCRRTPALSVINLQIAAAYRAKKDYAAALAAYNDLLKSRPTQRKGDGRHRGDVQPEKGDPKAAEETLTRAAGSETAGRDVFYTLGEIKSSPAQVDDATQWYLKASSADPSWGKPLYKLGLLALDRGRHDRRLQVLSRGHRRRSGVARGGAGARPRSTG